MTRQVSELFCQYEDPVLLSSCLWAIFGTEVSRCAYKRNIILNSVGQHNYFITQGNSIGYMFRL
jgi:hypothetical protein